MKYPARDETEQLLIELSIICSLIFYDYLELVLSLNIAGKDFKKIRK